MSETLTCPVDYLREALWYDPETGYLYWCERPIDHFKSDKACRRWNTRHAGDRAGSISNKGYRRVEIDAVPYGAARVAWAIHTKAWPRGHIDHMNGVRDDNRISNLRDVAPEVNQRNKARNKNNTSGVTGVKRFRQYWVASINAEGRRIHLGSFKDFDEAVKVRKAAERKYGYTRRHGTSLRDCNA